MIDILYDFIEVNHIYQVVDCFKLDNLIIDFKKLKVREIDISLFQILQFKIELESPLQQAS